MALAGNDLGTARPAVPPVRRLFLQPLMTLSSTYMKTVKKKIQPRKFVLRPYRRIPTWYSSYYLSGNSIGKGVVMNLSRTGLRIQGDHFVKPGMELSVRVSVEEDSLPLEILRASVRWVNQYEFGLKIDQLTPMAVQRITALINEPVSTRRNEPR
jgi:PilZ domain-containing protein